MSGAGGGGKAGQDALGRTCAGGDLLCLSRVAGPPVTLRTTHLVIAAETEMFSLSATPILPIQ